MNIGGAIDLEFGQGPVKKVTANQVGEALRPGGIWRVYATAAAVVTVSFEDGTSMPLSLPALGELKGRISRVEVTSGTVLIYGLVGVNLAAGVNPTTVSGLAAWYRADAGVTLMGSNGVILWADQSDAANNLAEGVDYPTFEPDGFALGRPSIYSVDGAKHLSQSGLSASTPFTVIVVAKIGSVAHDGHVVCMADDVDQIAINIAGGSIVGTAGTPVSFSSVDASWHIFTMLADTSSSKLQVDAGSPSTVDLGSNTAVSGLGLFTNPGGGELGADARVAELLVYNAALSDGNIAALVSYLQGRWPGL